MPPKCPPAPEGYLTDEEQVIATQKAVEQYFQRNSVAGLPREDGIPIAPSLPFVLPPITGQELEFFKQSNLQFIAQNELKKLQVAMVIVKEVTEAKEAKID